jgi:sodium/potassium-transporting ATPase subunit beta
MENEDYIEVENSFVETPLRAPLPPRVLHLTTRQKIKRAIYNPDTKQILGRTSASWGRLGIFYAIFYAVLAGIFATGMHVLLRNINLREPKWKLNESLIGTNPGLGFRPISFEEGALIWYDRNKSSTSEKWVKLVDEFLEPYREIQNRKNFQKCGFKTKLKPNSVCLIDVTQFGRCSAENQYGYNSSSPCVFIKLNKIFGWMPKFYTKPISGMPRDLVEAMKKLPKSQRNQIWVSCNGEDPVDKENTDGFNYYPGRGFPGYYYPYLNIENYLSPLVAVEILNPKPNIIINIECRAWAKNIFYKGGKYDRQGSVHFEILIDMK